MNQPDVPEKPGRSPLQKELFRVIFEADTPAGKAFDVALLILIFLSVITVILETVQDVNVRYREVFVIIEWIVTLLFTIEYILRIIAIRKKTGYIFSFYGIVDLLAILPTYISLIIAGTHYLLTIRALRLLRIFRIFKLGRYFTESRLLMRALVASKPKIIVFLVSVLTIVIFIGSVLYLIEHETNNAFSSIPMSMYWAIVTLTTVGYGDVVPVTGLGKFLAAILMITGYAIIAVPTGIVSAELAEVAKKSHLEKDDLKEAKRSCPACHLKGHEPDAIFCRKCGKRL